MMVYMSIRIDTDNRDVGTLACPHCDDEYIHIDGVQISARSEDVAPNEIAVNAITGKIETHRSERAPWGRVFENGRRQRIVLTGWCEMCNVHFSIVFLQHKGQTFVELGDRV